MLNGISPIILIHLKKNLPATQPEESSIPFVDDIKEAIEFPPIPIYLDPTLTGIWADTVTKNVDISTEIDTKSDGDDASTIQKSLNSTVTLNAVAKADSIGAGILASLIDQVFKKVTSKEYFITFIYRNIIVFDGLLHQFSISQREGTDLTDIQIILTAGTGRSVSPVSVPFVPRSVGPTPTLGV